MISKIFGMVLCAALVASFVAEASAVTLFSDNFNTDTSALWTTNFAPAANASTQEAKWLYDYSAMGIPSASGPGGDTIGLRLRADIPIVGGQEVTSRPAGVTSGLSLSPTGKDFGSNYKLTVDVWSNYFGSPNASGLTDNVNSEGGTNNVLFSIGTSGTIPNTIGQLQPIPGTTLDGISLVTTGDGGITDDYRLFANDTLVAANNPAYLAGGRVNTQQLYKDLFPAKAAPAVQVAFAPTEYPDPVNPMSGMTEPGTFGFAWHHVEIKVEDGIVTWAIDGTTIVNADANGVGLGGNNIAIGITDVNNTTARHPALVFTVFDNLVVSDLSAPAGQLGDFNNDTKVDAADYVTWRKNNVANASLPNDDGAANQADRYTLWRANFGNPPGTGSGLEEAAVPEPSSLVLLAVSAACCWFARRRS